MDGDKGITESGKNVVMTPEQFKKMLRQFYDFGYKHGRQFGKDEGIRTARDLDRMTKGNSDKSFMEQMFGSDFFGKGGDK